MHDQPPTCSDCGKLVAVLWFAGMDHLYQREFIRCVRCQLPPPADPKPTTLHPPTLPATD